MTQTFSALSIYGLGDRMDDTDFQRWLDFHKRLKYPPRLITLFTAAKFEQAPNLLRRVRDSLPDTTPVWRGYDGKDAWGNIPPVGSEWTDANFYLRLSSGSNISVQRAAELWFNQRVKPHLDVIHETGAIVHLLNEANAIFNAVFETECIRLLGEEGVRAGAFAWAAGTPDWNDYQAQVIADEVAMAAKYKALVLTHEYAGFKPEEQNSLINRNQTLVSIYDHLKLPKPDVYLGEFALAKATILNGQIHLDPDRGWRDIPVTEAQYSDFINGTTKTWYVPNKVAFSLYCGEDWGHNGSFGVMSSQGILDHLVTASEWMCFNVEDVTMPVATAQPIIISRPPEAKSGIRMRVSSIPVEYRNLRDSWSYMANITGQLQPGDTARRFDIPLHVGLVSAMSTGNWIFVEKLSDDTPTATVIESGYVWSSRITWEALGNSTQETPVVVPVATPAPEPTKTVPPKPPTSLPPPNSEPAPNLPPAAPSKTWLRYGLEIQTTAENHAAIELAFMTIFNALAVLGQAVGGSQVKITSDAVA